MAAAEIASGADSYTGNADLGGFNAGVIKIDTAPINQLNQYANDYNKTVWQQKIKDQDSLIEDLSKQNQLDLNDLIPEEKKQILDKTEALKTKGIELAKQLSSGSADKTTAILEWRSELKKTADSVDIANKRFLQKQSREKQISEETDPSMKAFYKKKLDEVIKTTPIDQPIPPLQAFDLKKAAIEKPPSMEIGVAVYGPNSDYIREDKHTIPDQKSINSQAAAIELGLKNLQVDKTSQEYLSKTPEEKKIIDDQQAAFEASGKLAEVEASKNMNAALQKYVVDGKIDVKAARSNGMLAGVFDTMDAYNAHMLDMQQKIRAGVYTGSDGVKQLDEKDYQPISYEDGDISAQDLLKPQILAKADAIKVTPKVTQSTINTTREKNAIDAQRANETARHDKATEGIQRMNAATNKARLEAQVKHAELKQKDPQTATAVETVYGGLMNKVAAATTTIYSRDKNKNVTGVKSEEKFDFIPTDQIPAGWTNINGVVTNDKGKLVVGKLDPFVSDNGQQFLKVKYYDPKSGKPIDANNDLIKEQYNKAKSSGYKKGIDDFIRTVAKNNPNLIMSEFVGQNGTANINSISQSLKATNASLTTKGEENIFGTEPVQQEQIQTNNADNLDQ